MAHPLITTLLSAPPFSWYHVLVVLLYVILISAAVIIWCLCVILLWSLYQRKQQVAFLIEIENKGNVDTPIQMNVELGELGRKVKTSWWLNKERQTPKSIQQISFEEEIVPASAAVAQPEPDPAADRKAEERKKKTEERKKKVKGAKDKAGEKVSIFKGLALTLASISSGLAAILPGDLKKPFKALANNILKTQSNASYVMNEPDRLAATGRQVQSNVKRLKNPTGPYIQKPGKPASSSQAAAVGGAVSSTAAVPTAKKVRHKIIKTIQMVETRLLNPAEKIIYTLIFKPNNPFISINGAFTVLSQQLEYDDFPSYNEIKPQSLTGELEIRRVAAGFIVLFVIACFILLVFAVGASLLAAGWLKGFLPLI